jgi:hypothetical protein
MLLAHELSQQRLCCRQRSFIITTCMRIRNQIIIRGKKHASIATLNRFYHNAQLVVVEGTHKSNHLFHHGINTN